MPEFGPYSERELADKLVKIPEEEILEFHKEKMKKFRIYYAIALFIGIASVAFVIIGSFWKWVGTGIAVAGIVVFSYVTYQKKRWERIVENMMYVKLKREKTIDVKEKHTHKHPSKYDKIGNYQKKQRTPKK
jgi:hypothetical protein